MGSKYATSTILVIVSLITILIGSIWTNIAEMTGAPSIFGTILIAIGVIIVVIAILNASGKIKL